MNMQCMESRKINGIFHTNALRIQFKEIIYCEFGCCKSVVKIKYLNIEDWSRPNRSDDNTYMKYIDFFLFVRLHIAMKHTFN